MIRGPGPQRRSRPVASPAVTLPGPPVPERPGETSGETPGTPGGEPPAPDAGRLVDELHAAFTRHRPQGSARWNFTDAFNRLEREFGAWVTGSPFVIAPGPIADGAPGAARGTGRARQLLHRLIRPDRVQSVPDTASIQGDGRGRVESGFDATLEALRYLAVRVGALEDALARRDDPIDGLAHLIEPPDLGPWTETLTAWLTETGPVGEVLHAECGDGALIEALGAVGFSARGAEPRGTPASSAIERGLRVSIEGAHRCLSDTAPGSLGALVLSGVVDRLALDRTIELLDLAADRLAEGAPIVVLAGDPAAVATGWSVPARDLLPGRPLHPQTWELLLGRAGFAGITVLAAPGPVDPAHAVTGRRLA
jgi:hypothetical protein